MSMTPRNAALPSWTSVRRWTLFGPLACVLASISFNLWMLRDYGSDVMMRVMIGAILLPIVLGAPLFFYFSTKLRGLAIANARLGRVARTDSLTACLNRGAFTSRVTEWLRDPDRHPGGALLMIDADNFKAINDLFGHDVGDEALTIIARSIRAVLRGGDLVGRMGGEEFGVFLPGVGRRQAGQIAERIRQAVSDAVFLPDGNKRRPLTVSIGGAVFAEPTTFADLFRVADQRLYGAKHAGRNLSAVVQVEDHPIIRLRQSA
jgi:diguanylate cyclase